MNPSGERLLEYKVPFMELPRDDEGPVGDRPGEEQIPGRKTAEKHRWPFLAFPSLGQHLKKREFQKLRKSSLNGNGHRGRREPGPS